MAVELQDCDLKPMKMGVPAFFRDNWELCMFRLSLYQKAKFLSQNPNVLDEDDEDMRRWTFKLVNIVNLLKVSSNVNKIASFSDLKMIGQLAEILKSSLQQNEKEE